MCADHYRFYSPEENDREYVELLQKDIDVLIAHIKGEELTKEQRRVLFHLIGKEEFNHQMGMT